MLESVKKGFTLSPIWRRQLQNPELLRISAIPFNDKYVGPLSIILWKELLNNIIIFKKSNAYIFLKFNHHYINKIYQNHFCPRSQFPLHYTLPAIAGISETGSSVISIAYILGSYSTSYNGFVHENFYFNYF